MAGAGMVAGKGYNAVTMIAHDYTFTVVLEQDDEAGGFAVHVPALPGCHTQGDTRQDAITMAQDAISGYIESLLEHNEPIPVEADPVGPVLVTVTVPQMLKIML